MGEEGGVKTKAPQRRDLIREDVNQKLREVNASFAERVRVGTFQGMARPRELTATVEPRQLYPPRRVLDEGTRVRIPEVKQPEAKPRELTPQRQLTLAQTEERRENDVRNARETVREEEDRRSRSVLSVVASGVYNVYDTIHDSFIGAVERLQARREGMLSTAQERAANLIVGGLIASPGFIMTLTGSLAQSSWLPTSAAMALGTAEAVAGMAVVIHSGLVA